jgi:glutathione S-transferase
VKHEHASPWYLGINPRGVVPVRDGVVHVESNDILAYLDALPSDADSIFPQAPQERAIVDATLMLETLPRLFKLYNRLLQRPAFAKETKTPAILSKVLLPAVRFGRVLRGKPMTDVAGDILAA